MHLLRNCENQWIVCSSNIFPFTRTVCACCIPHYYSGLPAGGQSTQTISLTFYGKKRVTQLLEVKKNVPHNEDNMSTHNNPHKLNFTFIHLLLIRQRYFLILTSQYGLSRQSQSIPTFETRSIFALATFICNFWTSKHFNQSPRTNSAQQRDQPLNFMALLKSCKRCLTVFECGDNLLDP